MSDYETDVDLHAIPCPRELPVEVLAEIARVKAAFAVPWEEFVAEMEANMAQQKARMNAHWAQEKARLNTYCAALFADLRAARAEVERFRKLNAAEAVRSDPSSLLQ